jgi:hypothetical protein
VPEPDLTGRLSLVEAQCPLHSRIYVKQCASDALPRIHCEYSKEMPERWLEPAKCTEQLALLSVKYPHSDPLVGANGTDDET